MLRGEGGYGRFLSPLVIALSQLGCNVVVLDLLGYGLTTPRLRSLTYDDWMNCISDFVDAETKDDSLKTVLFGLSLGGMLAYQVAAKNPRVDRFTG